MSADQIVFFAKEDGWKLGLAADAAPCLVDRAHVAAGAEGALAGAANDHGMDRRIGRPVGKGGSEASVVGEGQRVERLRPVDDQGGEATLATRQDLVTLAHRCAGSLRSTREVAETR